MSRCSWCGKAIPSSKRADAKTCSKRCRQSAWRFARHRPKASPPAGAAVMRLGYADPPYPGKAHLYRGHPDFGGEVDHVELVGRLTSSYDGWALHTSSDPGLQVVLAACDELGIQPRVASWHRGPRKVKALGPWRSWEAVVYSPARPVGPAGVSDTLEAGVSPRISDPRRVIGAKPAAVIFWTLQLLGARPGDQLEDLFPGSGGVERAWEIYCRGAMPECGVPS